MSVGQAANSSSWLEKARIPGYIAWMSARASAWISAKATSWKRGDAARPVIAGSSSLASAYDSGRVLVGHFACSLLRIAWVVQRDNREPRSLWLLFSPRHSPEDRGTKRQRRWQRVLPFRPRRLLCLTATFRLRRRHSAEARCSQLTHQQRGLVHCEVDG